MRDRAPCVPKRKCYFSEDEFWRGNRAGYLYTHKGDKAKAEESARQQWRDYIAGGELPPRCAVCGYHHWPAEAAK